jgi:hypothetical protein
VFTVAYQLFPRKTLRGKIAFGTEHGINVAALRGALLMNEGGFGLVGQAKLSEMIEVARGALEN